MDNPAAVLFVRVNSILWKNKRYIICNFNLAFIPFV